MKPYLPFVLLIVMIVHRNGHAQNQSAYIINGGFEYGLNTNWTHTVSPNADASFELNVAETASEGNVELKIHLNDRRGDKFAVSSTTTAHVANDSIYLLRFWARESETFAYEGDNMEPNPDFAKMIVTITGESGHTHEVLYYLRQGSTIFHLPFKTSDKQLNISFYPQTEGRSYFIDGVEVLDQTQHNNIDVLNTYIWNNNRSTTGRTWLAGDNDISYVLPDGRTVWVFNDSFISGSDTDVNDTTNNRLVHVGRFVRNAMVVEEVDGTLTDMGATDNNNNGQAAYFETIEEILENGDQKNFYWVGNMIMEEGMLKVYLVELDETGGLHDTGRSYIAAISYPELELVDIKQQAAFGIRYENIFVENDTIYLYKNADTNAGEEAGTHVARTPVGNLIGEEMWEFWNGTSWVKDPSQSVSIYPHSPEDVIKLEDNSYALLSGLGALSRDVYLSFAESPQGPWTPRVSVYTRPDDWKYWAYLPNFQKQLENGNYLISYSSNAWLPLFFSSWSFIDKYWYRQRHIQVDVYGLSPYSKGYDCAGIRGGDAFKDDCGKCVGGTTNLEPCITGKAILYDDCEYSGMAIGLDVGEYSLSELTAAGFSNDVLSSIELEEDYTIILYSEDDFQGNSLVIDSSASCLDTDNFDNMTSSVVVARASLDNMNGTYILQNKVTGLVMGTENDNIKPGTGITVQTPSKDNPNQQFDFNYIGNGYYTITHSGSGELLSVTNNSKEAQARIILSTGLDITDLGGSISAQHNDSPDNEGVENLIDNNVNTKFLTFNAFAWVQYQAPKPYIISSYSLTSANDADVRDPVNWTLSGSNDGSNWTVIDEKSGHNFPNRFQEFSFTISDNTTAYVYYRLDMEAKTGNLLQLSEWKLFEAIDKGTITAAQKFTIQNEDEAYFKIFNKNSNMLLEVLNDASVLPGAKVRQLYDFGQASALWKLITPGEEAFYDCNGDLNGEAYFDDCDICVDGDTGKDPCSVTAIPKNENQSSIQFIPNPVINKIEFTANERLDGSPITIYNTQGLAVWTGVYEKKPIDLSTLPAGVYVLTIKSNHKPRNIRFIKK